MESKYYIPDISEFKQGFKFERCLHLKGERIGSLISVNSDKPKQDFYAKEDEWIEEVVWWDREPSTEFKESKCGDVTVYWKECEMDLMPHYSLEILLKNGRIRAKR